MKHRNLSLALAAALALDLSAAASATDLTADLHIEATVENACSMTVSDATGLSLYSLAVESKNQTPGGVRILCNVGTAYSIEPDNGLNFGQSEDMPTYRALVNAEGFAVPYQLFKDVGGADIWGTGTAGITGVGTGEWQSHDYSMTFYNVAKAKGGNGYVDTVVVTATYN